MSKLRYEVLESVRSLQHGFVSRVALWPRTGRTHQLRKHMAHIGTPILGDKLHGATEHLASQAIYLFAVRLELADPITSEPRCFTAPLPSKFATKFEKFRRAWPAAAAALSGQHNGDSREEGAQDASTWREPDGERSVDRYLRLYGPLEQDSPL